MAKRIAALDLGTNTFHLLIADIADNGFQVVFHEEKHVKLGEGGITEGRITEAAFERGLEAMRRFRSLINTYGADQVRTAGTAALRSAANGPMFIDKVEEETGITIRLIEGELEAALIYEGVKHAVPLKDSALIIDIGGGSVEFIFCSEQQIFWKKSYPVGAARLMAMFHHSDPIDEGDVNKLQAYLKDQLAELKEINEQYKPKMLVGSAGAFETFAALSENKPFPAELPVKGYNFDKKNIRDILAALIASTHAEREKNTLITAVRTDMIVVASVLTSYILDELSPESVAMSVFSLKEGLLFSETREQ